MTAHHVLERGENINVGFQDGETVAAELLGRDPSTDLALLRTPKRGSSVPSWADPESLRVGHLVLALGRPGANVRAAMGIVAALGKPWRTPAGGPVAPRLQNQSRGHPLAPAAGDPKKVRAPLQTPDRQSHGSGREALATLGSAPGQHSAAGGGRHAGAKTMATLAHDDTRLEGAFHDRPPSRGSSGTGSVYKCSNRRSQ